METKKLKPSGSTVAKDIEAKPDGENAPSFGTGILRKTDSSTIDGEERAAKARESEQRAIERQKARKQKEEEEKAKQGNLQKQKETLTKEVADLKKQVKRYKKSLKAKQ